MPERASEEIRREIVAERLGLREDLDALKSELRVPLLIAGVSAVALLAVALFSALRRRTRRDG